jgi:DNA repair protein SbcD/Mre11
MSRILHTADWHLGARLAGEERLDEQAAFLKWLSGSCATLIPDLLIVAGDVFDSANPPQSAVELYYRFLADLRIAAPQCRILVIGGNHDSPAMLESPKRLLNALKIDVFGLMPENAADALVELDDCVICAVPFLRDRDLRYSSSGESAGDMAAAIRKGIAEKYARVLDAAKAVAGNRQVLATGHLAAIGVSKSESERAIYIGNLGAVSADVFNGFSYTALGHIHRAQKVGGRDNVRYAGAPLPMDFSESAYGRGINVIEVAGASVNSAPLPVPEFRKLLRIETNADAIAAKLADCAAIKDAPFDPWVELTITDGRGRSDLEKIVREASERLRIKVIKTLLPTAGGADAFASANSVSLAELMPGDVFAKKLESEGIEKNSDVWKKLSQSFALLLEKMHEHAASGGGGAA